MSAKNHIWPAYVDMMTVLLLVYILLNTMFSVVIANSEDKRKDEIVHDDNSSISDANIDNRSKEVNYNKWMYNDIGGDLSLSFTDDSTSLDNQTLDKLDAYIQEHKGSRGKYVISIFYHNDDSVATGELTKRQAYIYYDLLDRFLDDGVQYIDVLNKYSFPSKDTESKVKVRFVTCGIQEKCDLSTDGK